MHVVQKLWQLFTIDALAKVQTNQIVLNAVDASNRSSHGDSKIDTNCLEVLFGIEEAECCQPQAGCERSIKSKQPIQTHSLQNPQPKKTFEAFLLFEKFRENGFF